MRFLRIVCGSNRDADERTQQDILETVEGNKAAIATTTAAVAATTAAIAAMGEQIKVMLLVEIKEPMLVLQQEVRSLTPTPSCIASPVSTGLGLASSPLSTLHTPLLRATPAKM